MRTFDGRLLIGASALAVLAAAGGALAVSIFQLTTNALVMCAAVASLIAVVVVFAAKRRDSLRMSAMNAALCDALDGNENMERGGESPAMISMLKRIEVLRARLREETAARQVGGTRADELISVLHSLEDPVFVFDCFGTIRLANTAAKALSSSEAMCEQSDIRVFFQGDEIGELLNMGITEGRPGGRAIEVTIDMETRGATGERVYDVRTISLGEDATGPFVLVLHDLTWERELSRMKSDFVSKASHELRTPLASIRGYLEMLVDGEVDGEQEQLSFLEHMLDDTERLAALVDNMLNISRIEAGITRPQLERSDLGEIAQNVARMLQPTAQEKSISIRVVPTTVDLSVEGDLTMLQEVVTNLVSNAVKYTPDGGRVTVSIDTDQLARAVVVSVADTGMGIPIEAREQVFEKFFRVASYERMAKGTGLGLNLCKNIVESVHQGRIGVDSTVGEGSRFWFSIPMDFAGARAA